MKLIEIIKEIKIRPDLGLKSLDWGNLQMAKVNYIGDNNYLKRMNDSGNNIHLIDFKKFYGYIDKEEIIFVDNNSIEFIKHLGKLSPLWGIRAKVLYKKINIE